MCLVLGVNLGSRANFKHAAFLEVEMTSEMYIEPHPAMIVCGFMTEEQRQSTAIHLVKSMYGNVDAAIKFFKTLTAHITDKKGTNMQQLLADPCVFYKFDNDKNLILMVSVTVDDCAITGTVKNITLFMDGFEKRFNITCDGELKKHLGVEYRWGKTDDGKMFCDATMNKKADAILKHYEKYSKGEVKEYETPGTPNENLVKNDGPTVDLDDFRSLVGKVMFFSTKVCPKVGAAVRALSSHMSNPGESHWSSMKRLVGFIKGMGLKGIRYMEPECFQTASLADTDYGNCKETRRSVGCSFITIGGCIINWWMAKHQTVSVSSCKAEYKELAKCAKGVMFVHNILKEINHLVLPGLIGGDNQGAIFLAENKQVNDLTKHIDTQYHFIWEFVSNKEGKIFKIESKLNTADIGTKNVEVGLFHRHAFELDNGMTELCEKLG